MISFNSLKNWELNLELNLGFTYFNKLDTFILKICFQSALKKTF